MLAADMLSDIEIPTLDGPSTIRIPPGTPTSGVKPGILP